MASHASSPLNSLRFPSVASQGPFRPPLNIPFISGAKPNPFKFANFLASKKEFLPTVKSIWDKKIPGYAMFSMTSKLKLLKKPFRKLKYSQGNLSKIVKSCYNNLCKIQEDMVNDPFNVDLRSKEVDLLNAYTFAVKDEELFFKQRSKVSWLSEGDFNTKYFHNSLKERRNRSRNDCVKDMKGNMFSRNDVGVQFVRYFEKVLGRSEVVDPIPDPSHFFPTSYLWRLLSLCKIIANRLKGVLNGLVNDCQSAFIPSRQISDNIMLSQELMRNCHRKYGPSKDSFKIDIHKAYDTVDWGFLRQCLVHF
ncbi:retrovirus-related pol polyprotein from transposon TNT 1-94 [Tanacetum coccineum]